MKRWCDTGDKIQDWQEANPEILIGWSEFGRKLVDEYIQTYLDFLQTHLYVERDEEYINFLHSLKNPPPWEPPRHRHPQPCVAGSFYIKPNKS